MEFEQKLKNFNNVSLLFGPSNLNRLELLLNPTLESVKGVYLTEPNIKEVLKSDIFQEQLYLLLDFYSLLEVGFITDYLIIPEDHFYQKQILRILGIKEIFNFCFSDYESLLPINLSSRFESYQPEEPSSENITIPIFYQFLNSYQYLLDKPFLRSILRLGIGRGWYDDLTVPKMQLHFENRLPEEQRFKGDFYDSILYYIEYLDIVYRLLQQAKSYTPLESGVIAYHGRNFDEKNHRAASILDALYLIARNSERYESQQFLSMGAGVLHSQEYRNDFKQKLNYIQERINFFSDIGIFIY